MYPQPTGDPSKVKVKVRINIHGTFTVASASLLEKVEKEVEIPKEEKKTESKDFFCLSRISSFGADVFLNAIDDCN